MDLSNPATIFILLHPKLGKGGGGETCIEGREDVSYDFPASLDEEMSDDVELPRGPHLENVFPTGDPNLRYHRLVTLQGEDEVTEIFRVLWQGESFGLKCPLMTRKVRFASRHDAK